VADAITSLTCRTGPLCVGAATVGGAPGIITSKNPKGGAGAWHGYKLSDAQYQLHGMSCPSATLCVTAEGFYGSVLDSTNPTGGATTWHATALSTNGHSPYGVSCPTTSLCVAVDSHGGVYNSTTPGAANPSWTSILQINSYNDWMDGISCPKTTLCVAVDTIGRVVVSTTPTANDPSAWKVTDADGTNSIKAVSCTATPMCVAVDDAGNVLSSTNPAAASPTWKVVHVDGTNAIAGVSCPSTGLCVAVDDAGNAVASTNPTGNATAWTITDVDGTTGLTAVSCASTSLCVAGDSSGNILTGALKVYRPDAMIGKWGSTKLIGAKIYSATAVHETLSAMAKRGATAAFKIAVTNRGNVADTYLIKGPGNQNGWTVTYLRATTNVTKAVEAGTYKPTAGVGKTVTIKMSIKVSGSAALGSSKSWLVVARSTHNTAKKDAVKAVVKATA
jgi:tartrate dehydratase beta subunit/fumarate hydratase class I family protein